MKSLITYWLVFVLLIITSQGALAQFPDDQCYCKAAKIATDARNQNPGFYKDSDAQVFVKNLIELLNKYQPRPFTESIKVLPGTCTEKEIALATICDGTVAPKGRYILYNKKRMTDISNLRNDADLFVLAHEVGHHTHNHLHFEKVSKEAERQIEEAYKGKNFSIEKIKHIQELEADILAIWFLRLNNPQIDSVQIKKMIVGISKLVSLGFKVSTSDHPSFEIRTRMAMKVLKNWKVVFNNLTLPTYKTRKFVIDEIDSVLAEAEDANITEIERNLKNQVYHHRRSISLLDSARVFHGKGKYGEAIEFYQKSLAELELSKFYTDEEKKKVLLPLEQCRRIVEIESFFAIYPSVGVQYIIPALSIDRKPIDAAFKPTLQVGMRMGIYSWTRKSWYELSLNYAKQDFYTLLINGNNIKNSVEHFGFNTLTAGLHYTFSTIPDDILPSQSWKTGFVATIAPTYNYYFGNEYTNYVTQENKREIDIQPSFGGTIGIGIEKISRKRNKTLGNFRIMANYNYQSLKLGNTEPVRGNFKGVLHQFSLSISYRQW